MTVKFKKNSGLEPDVQNCCRDGGCIEKNQSFLRPIRRVPVPDLEGYTISYLAAFVNLGNAHRLISVRYLLAISSYLYTA